MPNPQVHVAVGMIGTIILIAAFYPLCKNFYKKYNLLNFLPILILLGAGWSMIPDIPELARYYPSVSQPLDLDYHDKPAWNTPMHNVFFFHPLLDSRYGEKYDTFGLILTLLVFNGISLFYLKLLKQNPTKKKKAYKTKKKKSSK